MGAAHAVQLFLQPPLALPRGQAGLQHFPLKTDAAISENSSAQSPVPVCAQLCRLLISWWKHFLILQQVALNNLLEKIKNFFPLGVTLS